MAGPYVDMDQDKFPSGTPNVPVTGNNSYSGGSAFTDKQLGAGAGGNALTGLISSLFGANQLEQGNDIMKNNKLDPLHLNRYNVPNEFKNNADQASMNYYNMMMPGQTTAENKIGGTTSGNIRAVTNSGSSGSDILSAITMLDNNEKSARNGIASDAAGFHQQNLDRSLNANAQLGQQEGFKQQYDNTLTEKEYENNTLNPYLRQYQRGLQMQGAGTQNIIGGISKGVGAAADLAMLFA